MTQPQTEHDAPRAGRSRARDRLAWRGAQLAGFAAGLALLAWVARGALADTGAAELRRLWRAGPGAASALLALSGLSILLTGAMFWAAVRPARPLRFWGVQAVNVIAFILALAPLKIGAIFRVLAHHRLDRLPLLTIGAWFIVVALIMAGVLVPMGLASLWRTRIDGAWLAASASGAAALLALMWLSARQGRAHLEAALLWSAGRAGARARGAVELRLLPRLREGAVMAGAGRWVVLGAGLRAADVLVQAARMVVASHLAGRAISPEQALLAGSTYVLIGALAPTGMLGVREAGAAGAGALAGETDLRLVVLLVTASEVLVALAAGAAAWVCLRPGRWLPRRRVTAP